MGYTQFLMWVAKQGLKNKVLQKYLNKAWQEASKAGKPIIEKNFPALLKKAQDLKTNFKTFKPKVVPKEIVKPKLQIDKSKQIIEGMKSKGPQVVNIGDRIIKQMQKEGKTVKFDDLVRIYRKKPPNLKAEGGIAQLLGEGGGVILPQPKPYNFEEKLDFLREIKGGVGPKTYLQLMSNTLNEGVEKEAITKEERDNFLKRFTGTISEDWTSAIDDENLYLNEGDYERYPPKKFDEGGFTGSDLYFQDKFNEFDWATRYNNMSPKEGFAQMWQDYKNSIKMEEDEWGKPPPIPSSVLRSGLGFIIKQLSSGKFNQGKRDFLEKIVKPPKPKPKVEKTEPYQFPSDEQIKKDIEEIFAEKYSKHSTKHAEGGLAGMLGETRSGYQGGGGTGYKDYWKMVQDKFFSPEVGGEEGSGMTIIEFADIYFPRKAEGGRIGLAEGDTPSQAWMRDYFFSSGYDDQGVITLDEYMNGPIGWNDYANHGPGKAKGGRVGFKEGKGIMSRVGDMVDARSWPYYGGKALQGLVNSAETLSKLPLAAGELGSKLLQQPPKKEMFGEALENITPGSWSENVGLTSLVEGMGEKRPDDAQTVGNILGLGTEIAVPTGGAFKAGQFLLNKASKAMGKVKDGKTLNKLVDEKLTDSGQSRRDFNTMVGTGGLMVALKTLGLGSVFKAATKVKPSHDVVMRLRTFIDDSDVMTDAGPVATGKWGGAFDVEGLSKAAQKTLVGIMKDVRATRRYPEDTLKKLATGQKKHLPKSVDFYDDILPEDSSYILEALQKAGHKVKFEHIPDMGGWSVDDILNRFKNDPMYKGTAEGAEKYKKFKEKTDKWSTRKKEEYHTDITDDYGQHHNPDVEDFFDTFYGVEKAEGGRIGLDAGGPPVSPANLHPLQRPMFYQGGLTKTVPPEKGPMPQGLQSNVYDGIIRPGVINGRN